MSNKTLRIGILANESKSDHSLWIDAILSFDPTLDFSVIYLLSDNWLDEIKALNPSILLARPGGMSAMYKEVYDERIYILAFECNYRVYPSPTEIFLYENKRFLASWLKANSIPHPRTHIFYDKNEALTFINRHDFPIVGKMNIGASGSGVEFINNQRDGQNYISTAFSQNGLGRRSGPNLHKPKIIQRGFHYLKKPVDIIPKLRIYRKVANERQKNFVVFQEFISHQFEWRVVRIGDSIFAHKKLINKGKASGSLQKDYGRPPESLLTFAWEITEKHHLRSVAIDIFESSNGYLVNEIQCIFGQSDKHQMIIEGIPGRYIKKDTYWVFEPGSFNNNQSFDLRLKDALSNIDENIIYK